MHRTWIALTPNWHQYNYWEFKGDYISNEQEAHSNIHIQYRWDHFPCTHPGMRNWEDIQESQTLSLLVFIPGSSPIHKNKMILYSVVRKNIFFLVSIDRNFPFNASSSSLPRWHQPLCVWGAPSWNVGPLLSSGPWPQLPAARRSAQIAGRPPFCSGSQWPDLSPLVPHPHFCAGKIT